MSEQSDHFSDLLTPGEVITGVIAGAGPVPAGAGAAPWFQLAWTHERLLVVRLEVVGGAWRPAHRTAVARVAVSLTRTARTSTGAAQLNIVAAELPGGGVTMVDIDGPELVPQLDPFLAAWGGPVDGAAGARPEPTAPGIASAGRLPAERRKILVMALIGLWLVGIFWGLVGVVGLGRSCVG